VLNVTGEALCRGKLGMQRLSTLMTGFELQVSKLYSILYLYVYLCSSGY
jgi:hypothetical protein